MLSGEAGGGLQTLEQIMLRAFKLSGYHVFSYSEFMSRIRGGNNSTQIRVSGKSTASCLRRIDIFVPFNAGAMERFKDRITHETVILGDRSYIDRQYLEEGYPIVEVPVAELARGVGGQVYTNILVLGILCGLLGVEMSLLDELVRQFFAKSGDESMNRNVDAAKKGYETGSHLLKSGQVLLVTKKSETVKHELLMNGIDAIGMGGLAGGCTFVSSYPMSPSTGVLVFFARKAQEFGIVVEQAEDEISAMNMALGSWYAGGRALVTTSGGGYALMVEGLSLAGCTETPLVIHLGQRPGPATGLPTRTEQADLEHALYSGHGEFPRMILAPGTIEQGFALTLHAFNMADKYQVPVFILTDQCFLESNYTLGNLEIPDQLNERFIIETDAEYKRYTITENGVSPRGIPGFGNGLVCADSDEHDEAGYITEDSYMRTSMVEKRLRKLVAIEKDSIPPTLTGNKNYRHIVVGWGSTFHVVKEALSVLNRRDVSFLHFSQVYPLHPKAQEFIRRAEKRIIIENNATSQFARLIKQQTGIEFEGKILKYDGMPFMLEDVAEKLDSLL
ncbi:MAG TPA: 2-oxoacid:acceptor oxidoreductase subunit alpha [Desulfomonilia bacterium]|nr:2-oxoacid:acceptor oxidoreductase subunit alpha [Desulfomonilia bacterium]